jgi:hypothetical protein
VLRGTGLNSLDDLAGFGAMLRKEMRRSSIWFIIATFWLVDTVLRLARGKPDQAWLPGVITLVFLAVGIMHRRWEDRRSREGRMRRHASSKPE